MDEPTFTTAYLNSQLAQAWELSGTREFWLDPDNLERAVRALGICYLRLDHKPTESDQSAFDATIRNLALRHALLLANPPSWFQARGESAP